MVLVAPAGIGFETSFKMRLATIPVLGELMALPSRLGMRIFWKQAFHDPSFVTNDFIETKCALACAPGANLAVLRTLRGLVSLAGFRVEQIAPLKAFMRIMMQPTLIIWGQQDRLVPPDHARILEARLPLTKSILFDQCGHLPQLEKASQFKCLSYRVLKTGGLAVPTPQRHAHGEHPLWAACFLFLGYCFLTVPPNAKPLPCSDAKLCWPASE
jgi:pimeloyl-ACP methyl ester carboxylesterase